MKGMTHEHRSSVTSPSTPKVIPREREIFARNFKAAREVAGLSQRDVYKLTGIGYTYLSRVENCRENISLDKMAILAAAVKKPLHELLAP
jgi:transcriptional regulator with XRE-family HTH domain